MEVDYRERFNDRLKLLVSKVDNQNKNGSNILGDIEVHINIMYKSIKNMEEMINNKKYHVSTIINELKRLEDYFTIVFKI